MASGEEDRRTRKGRAEGRLFSIECCVTLHSEIVLHWQKGDFIKSYMHVCGLEGFPPNHYRLPLRREGLLAGTWLDVGRHRGKGGTRMQGV